VDLDIINRGARTNTRKRDSVQFVACRDLETGMLDHRITQRTTIIGRHGTTVNRVRVGHAFNHVVTIDCRGRCCIAAAVDRRAAEDNQTAPFANGVFRVGLRAGDISFGCQDDRIFLRSVREYLGATVHDDIVCATSAEDCDAGLNRQRRRITGCRGTIGTDVNADIQTPDNFVDVSACQTNIIGHHTRDAADRLVVDFET